MPAKQTKKKQKKQQKRLHFSIDCTVPLTDNIMDSSAFEKFLNNRIKVNGKAGALGDSVKVSREKTRVNVAAVPPFSKRYLKYLTKKFLKKHELKDYLRVVSSDKKTYKLNYYNIDLNENQEDQE